MTGNTAPKLLSDEQAEVLREMRDELASQCDGRPDADNCITCRVRREVIDAAIAIAPPSGEGVYKPSPNWCRTCGKHWRDPAAVFCSDSIHREATTPQSAPVDGDVCNVDGTWLWGKLMDWCRSRGSSPASYDSLFAIAEEAHKEQCGDKRLLRECYEWLFESCSDGPRVSEGALTNGSYTREFHALHDRLISAIGGAETVLATPPPASQERGGEVDRMAWRLLRHPDLRAVLEYAVENSDDMQAMGCLRRLDRILAASPPSSAAAVRCHLCHVLVGKDPCMLKECPNRSGAAEQDEDQRGTELIFQSLPERVIDGETLPSGMYCWYADYPEEGVMHLEEYEEYEARMTKVASPPSGAAEHRLEMFTKSPGLHEDGCPLSGTPNLYASCDCGLGAAEQAKPDGDDK